MYGSKNNVQDKESVLCSSATLAGTVLPEENQNLSPSLMSELPRSNQAETDQDLILDDYFSALLGSAPLTGEGALNPSLDAASKSLSDEIVGSTVESSISQSASSTRSTPCFDTAIAPNRLLSIPLRAESIPFIPAYVSAVRALQCLLELLGFLRAELPLFVRKNMLERCDEMIMLFRFSRHYKTMRVPHER